MKNFLLIAVLSVVFLSCKTTKDTNVTNQTTKIVAPANPTDYANTITTDELKEMLYVYASDEFEGRNTGDAGHDKAVDYLTQFYKDQNITSAIKGANYIQNVPLNRLFVPEVELEVNGKSYGAFDSMISRSYSYSGEVTGKEVVYVGFGIDEENYSDYSNLDVKDKIVVAKAGEPMNEDGSFTISGTTEKTKWSNGRQGRRSKRDAAVANGAKAFIYAEDASFNYYSKVIKQYYDGDKTLGISLDSGDKEILFLLVSEAVGNEIVGGALESNEVKTIPAMISASQKSKSKPLNSSNVAAIIEGSEFPNEYIVVSAHLDHVGVNDKGEVYNGADDDGSGTVAVLEMAEAFNQAVKAGHAPKRSVVFLHVTGEEKGLLGSRYYTDMDPIFPLEDTVANLNIDMIGRTDPKRTEGSRNYIYLIGSDKLSTELHNLSETVNSKYTNIELDYKYNDDKDPNRFYYRSDHYNFAKNDIPIIFYFNGTHADYHKVGDTPDKIQYDLLENRTRLVFYTAWELANRTDRIVVDKAKEAIGSN
jgi:hypothetical protein